MTIPKTFLIASLSILCFLTGCGKKPKQVQTDAVPAAAAPTEKKDSADVFNEYYSDSAVALDKAKNIKTFSLKAAKKTATDDAPGSYTPSFSDNGRFVVQVASMASRWLADEVATQLKEKGYPSYVLEVQNPTPSLTGTYYRVRVGEFATSIDAKAFGENILVPARFNYWVDRKANESSAPLESGPYQSTPNYGISSYTPPTPTPAPAYESTIVPGPGTVPSAPPAPEPTPTPSSSGMWQDSTAKW